MFQLSHLYMTIGKNTALTIWTFVGKVMSLLFNMLSRFVRAFLPRSKHLFTVYYSILDLYYVEDKSELCRGQCPTYVDNIYELLANHSEKLCPLLSRLHKSQTLISTSGS